MLSLSLQSFDFDWVLFHPDDSSVPVVMIVCAVIASIICVALVLYASILVIRKYRAKKRAGYAALPDAATGTSIQGHD